MGCGASTPACTTIGAIEPTLRAATGESEPPAKIDYKQPLPGERGDVGPLKACAHCGRSFAQQSYGKHVNVCAKVFQEHRPTYDSAQARVAGTGAELFLGPHGKPLPSTLDSTCGSCGATAWRLQDAAFHQAMQAARC